MKNSVVAIMLLAGSYGVYQFITRSGSADPGEFETVEPVSVTIGEPDSTSRMQTIGEDGPGKLPSALADPNFRLLTEPGNTISKGSNCSSGSSAATSASGAPQFVNRSDQALLDDLSGELNQPEPATQSEAPAAGPLTKVIPKPNKNKPPSEIAKNLRASASPPLSGEFNTATIVDTNILPTGGSQPSDLAPIWSQVERAVADEDFKGALATLSPLYSSLNLPDDQRQKLMQWLNVLAAKVIYSTEHNFSPVPYVIQPNETLADIANRWQVPADLVYNINQTKIFNPEMLEPGTELKKIEGPFRAEIDVSRNVLTLFLGNLFAGQFAVRLGTAGEIAAGSYRVVKKSAEGHTYYDSGGRQFPVGSPDNGYGENWIGLEKGLCLHAISDPSGNNERGCIGLNRKDAKDVFAILSSDSTVTILR
jgi:lipoprotein-anchoring transpeptidase ErfK/SrfK